MPRRTFVASPLTNAATSRYAIRSEEKLESERRAFSLVGDSFRKIIVRDDVLHRSFDEAGVLHVNLLDFLLDESIV